MKRSLAVVAAVAASVLGAAGLSLPAPAADWDTDGNGVLSQEEFGQGFRNEGVFNKWDEDGDGMLSEDEFTSGVFIDYDRDGSGELDESEYGDIADQLWVKPAPSGPSESTD